MTGAAWAVAPCPPQAPQVAAGMETPLVECAKGGHFHVVTPLLESWALSQVAGTTVFLKCENVQPAGSFKIRGIGHFCQEVRVCGQEGRSEAVLEGGRMGVLEREGVRDPCPQPHPFSSQAAKKGCRHLVCSSGDPTPFYSGGSPGLGVGEEALAGAATDIQGSASFLFRVQPLKVMVRWPLACALPAPFPSLVEVTETQFIQV